MNIEKLNNAAEQYAKGCGIENWTMNAFKAGAEWFEHKGIFPFYKFFHSLVEKQPEEGQWCMVLLRGSDGDLYFMKMQWVENDFEYPPYTDGEVMLWSPRTIQKKELSEKEQHTIARVGIADQHKWISVEDELPPLFETVLVYRGIKGHDKDEITFSQRSMEKKGYFTDKNGFDTYCNGSDVVMWMRIPDIPKSNNYEKNKK